MASMERFEDISEIRQAKLMGTRLAQVRIRANLTQQQLADRAGLGLRTVQRLERGEVSSQLIGFLKVCRVLRLSGRLEAVLPEQSVSPLELLRRQAKPRRRVRPSRKDSHGPGPWTWGKE